VQARTKARSDQAEGSARRAAHDRRGDGAVLIIPFENVKYIQAYPAPKEAAGARDTRGELHTPEA